MMEADKKRNAVFLDRDGVLCEDTDYVTSFEKMHIYDYAKEAIRQIHKKGYLAIVVTNQSGVAREMMTEQTLIELNQFLQKETGVDAVYYCPHLPPESKVLPPYRVSCSCRKPGIGMLKQAVRDFAVDLSGSFMVGDRESDIITGKNAGVKTVYISNRNVAGINADVTCSNVLIFAEIWL